jgi:large subunit ribosomal protein L10
MNRVTKEAIVEQLKSELAEAPLIAMIDYRGVTVEQINKVRRQCEANGIRYYVRKNTLVKKAIEGTEREGVVTHLSGMTGLILAGSEGVEAAKHIRELMKDFKKLDVFTLKGGFFDGEVLDAKGVDKVADYPSKEELLTMLLRTIQEGPRQVLGVIQGPARDLVTVLKNYEHKLTEGDGE